MKKIILVFVTASLIVCSFAPAAFADTYTDGWFTWDASDADWNLQITVPFKFDHDDAVYIMGDLRTMKGYAIAMEIDPLYDPYVSFSGQSVSDGVYDNVAFFVINLAGTKLRIAEFDIPFPPSPGGTWAINVPNNYEEYTFEYNGDILNTGSLSFELGGCNIGLWYGEQPVMTRPGTQFISMIYYPAVTEPDVLPTIGQSLQGVIGWVGQVVPTITEYPGFIMMIAVPLCVGIVTWVTSINKRRRG